MAALQLTKQDLFDRELVKLNATQQAAKEWSTSYSRPDMEFHRVKDFIDAYKQLTTYGHGSETTRFPEFTLFDRSIAQLEEDYAKSVKDKPSADRCWTMYEAVCKFTKDIERIQVLEKKIHDALQDFDRKVELRMAAALAEHDKSAQPQPGPTLASTRATTVTGIPVSSKPAASRSDSSETVTEGEANDGGVCAKKRKVEQL